MREAYWDRVRGAAILAVVLIHACGKSQTFPTDSPNLLFGVAMRQFVDFAVPMFLALSGYFAATKPIDDAWPFYRSRMVRILWPYLSWTFVYVAILNPSAFLSPTAMAFNVFLGGGIGIGYFVIVLIQMVILTPFIVRIRSAAVHVGLMIAVTSAGLLLTYILQIFYPEFWLSQFPYNGLTFIVWYPFYHLGLLLRWIDCSGLRSDYARLALLALCIIGIAASFLEASLFLDRGNVAMAVSQIRISSFLTSTALFLLVVSYSGLFRTANDGALAWLGRNSYYLYLSHILVLLVLTRVFAKVPHLSDVQPLYVVALAGTTILICSAGLIVARRILPPVWQMRLAGS